jgi:hypothetical protein
VITSNRNDTSNFEFISLLQRHFYSEETLRRANGLDAGVFLVVGIGGKGGGGGRMMSSTRLGCGSEITIS